MEVQFSIHISDSFKQKAIALGTLLSASAIIVGVQWVFPQAANYISCLLLVGWFVCATWPRTYYPRSTPMLEDAAELVIVPANDPLPVSVKPDASPKTRKAQTTRKPSTQRPIRTNLQAVPA